MAHGAAVFTLADVFYTLFLAFLNNTNGAMGTSQILYKCIPCYRFFFATQFVFRCLRIDWRTLSIYTCAPMNCVHLQFFSNMYFVLLGCFILVP